MVKKLGREAYISKTFAREWRKHLDFSQQEIADRMEIEQGTLSKIERGEIKYTQDTLERLSEALGIDAPDLLGVNPLQPNPPRLIIDNIRKASPDLQRQILAVVEAMLKAG